MGPRIWGPNSAWARGQEDFDSALKSLRDTRKLCKETKWGLFSASARISGDNLLAKKSQGHVYDAEFQSWPTYVEQTHTTQTDSNGSGQAVHEDKVATHSGSAVLATLTILTNWQHRTLSLYEALWLAIAKLFLSF